MHIQRKGLEWINILWSGNSVIRFDPYNVNYIISKSEVIESYIDEKETYLILQGLEKYLIPMYQISKVI